MFKLIAADIMVEELNKKTRCESCGINSSDYLYLCQTGIFKVLSHVCSRCKLELENTDCKEIKIEFMYKEKPIR